MPDDLQELKQLVVALAERVSRLEQAAGVQSHPPPLPRPTLLEEVLPVEPPPIHTAKIQAKLRSEAATPKEGLEARIGSHWFNRIGIVAVLIGVSLFLKYAFENNWIGSAGRVSIGLLAGFAVVIWSERFRRRGYTIFSYSLKAVGIGTMYLSLWAAFQVYHLVPGGVAFAAMILVTGFTAVLALSQDAQVLAAFAIAGGFATPLLLSTGQNHEIVLFSYVGILDLAALILVAVRPWMRLLVGSFAGTLVLYSGWYDAYYSRASLGVTVIFATIFFLVFALAPVFALRKPALAFPQVPWVLLFLPLATATAYFLAIYIMLESVSRQTTAWVAVALAAVYLLLSRYLQKRAPDEASRLLNLLYIALAVGFLTVAIPLKLETHWITLGWLAESAVLLWIGYRVPNSTVKSLATIALALGVFRLLVYDNFHPARLLLNARFSSYLVAMAALAWGVYLVLSAASGAKESISFTALSSHNAELAAAAIAVVLINVLGVLALSLEAHDYFLRQLSALQRALQYLEWRRLWIMRDFTYSAIWMLYGAGLMVLGFWKRSAFLRWQALLLLAFTSVKVFIYDTSQLDRGYRIASFICLGGLLLAVSFVYQRDWLHLSGRRGKSTAPAQQEKGSSSPA